MPLRIPPSGCDNSRSFVNGLIEIAALANAHFHAVAAHHQPGVADTRIAQDATNIITQGLELFLANRVGVDFEQNVRTALKVEAQHHMTLRPLRPALHHLVRQKIWNGKQANDKCRQHNRQRLPPREIKHDVPTCGSKAEAAAA